MASEERSSRPSGRAIEIVALLLVAPAAAAAGFFLMYHPSAAGNRSTDRDDAIAAAVDGAPVQDGGAEDEAGGGGAPIDGLLVRPAPNVKLGEPYYFRCWEAGKEAPLPGDACDRMRPLERAVAANLGVVVGCYERLDRPNAKGTLSLAIDVAFGDEPDAGGGEGELTFWAGKSTTIDGADEVITCVRSKLDGLKLTGIRHRKQRYTIFFPVEFGGSSAAEGTPVRLVLDRVRLREEPVNGKIIARLKQGEPITVYEVRDGWAKIKTVDGREGWIFDDAITLREE